MLKLIQNEIPSGTIDWVNIEFKASSYIWYIQTITVDWTPTTDFTFEHDTISVTVAPVASISISFFSREERDILGNWEVTMWDLIDEVYDEIGRTNYSKIYPKEKVRRDLNKTMWVILDDTPERSQIQHYSFKGLNWLTVSVDWHTVDLTKPEAYALDIEGSFLVGKWLYYNYFDYDGSTFTVSGADLIDAWDKMIIGHRIPYWVERVSEVFVNWIKLEYIDSRSFYLDTADHFTIIKDYQWNEYLYLPFNSVEYSCVVKFIPDYALTTIDEDIINVPYRYTRVFVYDVCYRLLWSREDDRWQYYKALFEEEYKKYKWYKAKATRKTKSKIWFASTFWERDTRRMVELLPEWIYDPYL